MSEVFGITRQALYKRLAKEHLSLMERDIVIELVREVRKEMPRLGTYKVYYLIKDKLAAHKIKMGRDKFYSLLREERMLIKRKKNYTKTTNSMHRFKKHKNLIKEIEIKEPEQVWVSDITYIKTEQGHEYLSLITDYYSKKIVGYHLADNLKTEGPLKALQMALSNRQYPDRKLIHHSDRGLQYCSDEYVSLLTNASIGISMTQAYDPYENAVAERVNGILKGEFGIGEGFVNHQQAIKEITNSINTYNQKRPHLSCELNTPNQAHQNPKHRLRKWGRLSTKKTLLTKEKSTKKENSLLY